VFACVASISKDVRLVSSVCYPEDELVISSTPARERIVFLDWLRGLAALVMLQGHVFNSFLRPGDREHALNLYSTFFGGEASAIFLFVTGITYGLGMFRRSHLPAGQRVLAALRRARYLFLLAILFRVQLWLFGQPYTSVSDLWAVDVLNLMGAAAALLCVIALAREPMQRFRWALLAGVLIAVFAPVVANLDTSAIPKILRDYLVPGTTFSIFPWGCYLAFGLAVGNAIPLVEHYQWSRVMQWSALCGLSLIVAGLYFSNLPYSIYPKVEFWIDSPGLVAGKLGGILLLGTAAFLWTEYFSTGWSWVRLLGTTSLAVYWVHVELVYGRWFWFLKEQLTPWQCVGASAVLIVLMVAMCAAIRYVPWPGWLTARFKKRPAAEAAPAELTPV